VQGGGGDSAHGGATAVVAAIWVLGAGRALGRNSDAPVMGINCYMDMHRGNSSSCWR
jgi:hypothetical protein